MQYLSMPRPTKHADGSRRVTTTLPVGVIQTLTEEADRLGLSLSEAVAFIVTAALPAKGLAVATGGNARAVSSGIPIATSGEDRPMKVGGEVDPPVNLHRHTWGPRSKVTGLRRCECGEVDR